MLSYVDIQTFVMVLFTLFAAIIVLDKIVDIVKKYRAPGIDMNDEIENIKGHLDSDHRRISALEESSKLMLRGLNAIIEFSINGDVGDKKKLESVKEDITHFLINKG